MANIIAPGVTVNITNESFFAANAAGSVPLFFIATAERKTQSDGVSAAAGTYENNVVRLVTSLKQSTQLYGTPRFLEDVNGNQLHGDARNEYGLFALNQYLSLGNLAYVIRANINNNDTLANLRSVWTSTVAEAAAVLESLAQTYIDQYNESNGYSVNTPAFQGYQIVDFYDGGSPALPATTTDTALGLTDGVTYEALISVDSETIDVDGVTWESGVATYVTIDPHNLIIGDYVTITGMTPSGYNGTVQVADIGTTGLGDPYFTVDIAVDPGAMSVAGTMTNGQYPISYAATVSDIETVTWASNKATYETQAAHNLTTGQRVIIAGISGGSPSSYDGTFTVTVTGATTFTVNMTTNPGFVGGSPSTGTVESTFGALIETLNTQLNGDATVSLLGRGDIKVLSTTSGVGSTVDIVDINTGLFGALTNYNAIETAVAGTGVGSSYKTRLSDTEILSLTSTAMADIWNLASFTALETIFLADHRTALAVDSTLDYAIYAGPGGYSDPATGYGLGVGDTHFGSGFYGYTGEVHNWVAYGMGSGNHDEQQGWTPEEAKTFLIAIANDFEYTLEFFTNTSLGNNDTERRATIVTALQESIVSNTEIRSEAYEYNMIVCPGYPEVVDDLATLNTDIQNEAIVVADTPFDLDPEAAVSWGNNIGSPTAYRQRGEFISYSYPHGLAANLDGVNVFCASSGIALRTMGYSDSVSYVWFAPAGLTRGRVTGVTDVGYVSGTLGTATTFVPVALNKQQYGSLYNLASGSSTCNINPIVFFPGKGVVVWGQKTSASETSAMDRINVVRLLAHIKRQLRKATLPFVFEPNDQLTRDNVKAVCDNFLANIMTKRGLYDFAVQCDASNNDGQTIDNNELIVDIACKPVKASEYLIINLRVVSTSASI